MNITLTQAEEKAFLELTPKQQYVAERFPRSLDLYLDYYNNPQIPAGTRYNTVQVYVNHELIVAFENGELVDEADEQLNLDAIFASIDEVSIQANGEFVWIKAGGELLLDHTQLNPLTITKGAE